MLTTLRPERGELTAPPGATALPDAVLAASRLVRVAAGETVLLQHHLGGRACLVVEGRLKTTQHALGRKLTILGPGDVFGELPPGGTSPCQARAQTLTGVTMRAVDRRALDELLHRDPSVAIWLIGQVARQVRRATHDASDLVFSDVTARVARVLVDLAENLGHRDGRGVLVVAHGLTQTELAHLACASRDSVNKTLASFAARGWIEVSKGTMWILDRPSLTRRAGPPGPTNGAPAPPN